MSKRHLVTIFKISSSVIQELYKEYFNLDICEFGKHYPQRRKFVSSVWLKTFALFFFIMITEDNMATP